MTALVDPPTAPLTRMAFSKASFFRTLEIHRSSRTISTIRRPDMCAKTPRRESTAGIAALCGSDRPRASTIDAMVEAVPMVMQCPAERDIQDSASLNSIWVIVPAFTSSLNCQTSVPDPMSPP